MNKIDQVNKISLHTDKLPKRIAKRDLEFAERIKAAIGDVNGKQHIADDAVEKVIKGEMGIHEGMMALGKAETSLKILTQVRTKVMTAYNEVMRMQV